MSKYVIDSETLTSIGNAVRNKGKTSDKIKVSELANTINNLPMDEFFEQYIARSFTTFESDTDKPIPLGMFYKCTKLTYISLPNTTSVGPYAIEGCLSLKNIDLPKVEEIGQNSFKNCNKLETISVPSIKRITGSNAFLNCTALKSFPYFDRLEEIGGYVFPYCTSIEEKVWVFDNLTTITAQQPFNSTVAEVIVFKNSVSQMDRIFAGMSDLRVVDLHKAFKIGRYAFQNSPNMEALILRDAENLFGCLNQDVLTSNTNYYVYVPATLLESYKSATNWSVAPERFRVIEDYPEITGGVYE